MFFIPQSAITLLGAGEMSTSLDTVGVVLEKILTWVGSLITTISSQPLLVIPIAIFVIGAVIGLSKRLIGA